MTQTAESMWLLLAFLFFVETALCSFYPIINATGNHYEVGYQIGSQAKDRIKYYVDNYPSMPQIRTCLNDANCMDSLNKLVEFNKNMYPDYFSEMEGVSNGSGVDMQDIIFLNFELEIGAFQSDIPMVTPMNLHCSDMLVKSDENHFIGNGHNEDDWVGTFQSAYYVNATFTDSNSSRSYFAFTYPGSLSGNAFSINYYGTSMSVNYVFPTNITNPARSLNFLSRQLLDAKDLNDADNIIQSANPYCSYGGSFNIGYDDEISNFEVGLNGYNQYNVANYSYHFNMYLRLNISQEIDPSSLHRMNRTNQLIQQNGLTSMQNIRTILGDTQDEQYPLYRNSNPPDCCSTLATVIFDRIKMNMNIFEHCNPKQCQPTLIIPIIQQQ